MSRPAKGFIFILCAVSIVFLTLNVIIINIIVSNRLGEIWQLVSFSPSNSRNLYSDETRWTVGDILNQANKYQQIISKDSYWSACYGNYYLAMIYFAQLNQPQQEHQLFFDIGANKGYTIASWLSTWIPEMNINSKTLYIYLSQVLQIKDCGACLDCNETISNYLPINTHRRPTLEIHAFEPMKTTYQVLRQVRNWMNISTLSIHHIAISNITGIVNMKKCPVGGEACGLVSVDHSDSNTNIFQTETITLDDFIEQKKINQKIDLLKIDTEGADPLVLQGAKKLFSKKQIRMIIFENHEVGTWKIVSLFQVIDSLDSQDFICYMLGKTGLVRLTNCWSSIYNVKRWSNVLCVQREEQRLRRFFDSFLITNI